MSLSSLRRAAHRSAAGLGITAVALGTAAFGIAGPASAADGDTVTLLNINDFHGRITSSAKPLACTIVNERKSADDSVLLSAGDNIGASEFASYIDDDNPTIDYLNSLDLAASATGNHEYDKGYPDLRDRVQERADWPYLAANVTADGKPTTDPYEIVDAGDVKVAVVGAVTQETPALTSPAGLEGVKFTEPVAAVNAAITDLEDSGDDYDVLVVEYHEGSSGSAAAGSAPTSTPVFDRIVGETSADADVIFTAHTHQTYSYEAPVPGEAGETRPIVQTGSYGENLGKVTLESDADGDWDAVADDTALVPTADTDLSSCADDATYTAAAKIADDATANGDEAAKKSVGTITDDITTAFDPSKAEYADGTWSRKAGVTDRGDDRGSSSTLSDELADSMVWATQQDDYAGTTATIGVMNPGGVRADLAYAPSGDEGDGVVTFKEANDIVPFVNNLSTVTLTGAQLEKVLEQQWQRDENGDVPSRGYLQLGLSRNVSYSYDEDLPEGERITSVTIDGKPLDPQGTYSVVAASFLVAGGDNFRAFTEGSDVADTGLLDRDAWISYLQSHDDLAPDYSQRGGQVLVAEAADGAKAGNGARADDGAKADGSAGTVHVSSLESRSLGAPQIETATLTIDGKKYTGDYVQAEDGTWGADIDVDLPAGEYTAALTTTPDTGTKITVPLTLTGDSAPDSFSDVPEGSMFHDEIMWAADKGYVKGWDDGTFRPVGAVNRDAMAAFLYRMAGEPDVDLPKASPFSDVKPTDEHYEAIVWAQQQGITTGWKDGTFRPTKPIARDAMAAFVYRYSGEPSFHAPPVGPFADVSVDTNIYAKEIAWLQSRGVTTGWKDKTYRPGTSMHRDAMAAFMYRMDQDGIAYEAD